MPICNNLTSILSQLQLSQAELSEKSGLNKASISRYVSGKTEPKASDVKALSVALGVSSDRIIFGEKKESDDFIYDTNTQIDTDLRRSSSDYMRKIPVIGWAHAGQAMVYEEMPTDYLESLPMPENLIGKKVIGLIVDGDSMVPEVHNKDKVAVLVEEEAWNGCLVVSKLKDDQGVTIRRLQRLDSENVRLIPYNTIYEATKHHLSEFSWMRPVAFIHRDMTNPNN